MKYLNMWREKGGKVVGGWHLQYANIPQGTRYYTICSNKIVKIKCCSGRVLTRINFQGACHSGFGMVSALFCTIADEESLLSGPESLSLPPDMNAFFLMSITPGVCLPASILCNKERNSSNCWVLWCFGIYVQYMYSTVKLQFIP